MKKKIFMFALAACLIILSIAGSSMAYFTDTDSATKVFTAGNVEIELLAPEENESATQIFPGQSYATPVVIKNTGTEKAFVGATIELTCTSEDEAVVNSFKALLTNIESIIGVTNDNNAYTVKAVETASGFCVYIVVNAELAVSTSEEPGKASIPVAFNIPAAWNHNEVNQFNSATVSVTAYATQTVGFDSAVDALNAAFGWTISAN